MQAFNEGYLIGKYFRLEQCAVTMLQQVIRTFGRAFKSMVMLLLLSCLHSKKYLFTVIVHDHTKIFFFHSISHFFP
jgi:hypothetical protein